MCTARCSLQSCSRISSSTLSVARRCGCPPWIPDWKPLASLKRKGGRRPALERIAPQDTPLAWAALAMQHDSQLAIVANDEFNNLTYRRLGPILASLFRALGESEVDADSMRFAGGAHARSRRPAADGCP